jgi:hypothetical protein
MKYLIYYCMFFCIVLLFAYINTNQAIIQQKEAFTPKIRELYRPYIRNARIISEGFYEKHSTNISNLFRKFGIM